MKLKILLIGCLIANISQVYSDPKIMKQMKKMDSDKSGSITFEEFNSSSIARFKLMDSNGDGNISQEEFLIPSKERFEKMDLNSDGVLKRIEIRKHLSKIERAVKINKKKNLNLLSNIRRLT